MRIGVMINAFLALIAAFCFGQDSTDVAWAIIACINSFPVFLYILSYGDFK